jgi:hypothetical protein
MTGWRFWEQRSVPPSPRECLVPYGLMLIPAAVAALLIWPWWIAALLAAPGFGVYVKKSRLAAKAQGVLPRDETGAWIVGAIGAPIAVVLADMVKSHADSISTLVFVGFLIIVVDPAWRLVWQWRRQRG